MKAIPVRADEAVKEQAEAMLGESEINITASTTSSLKESVREEKIPFDLATNNYLTEQTIMAKLAGAEKEANMPYAKWYSHDEIFGKLREKYGYEV